MRQKAILVVVLCAMPILVLAQERTITGTIVSTDGEKLANVKVLAPDSKRETLSGEDGTYSITVPESEKELEFFLEGMNKSSVTIGVQNIIDITMASEGSDDIFDLSLEDLMNMEVTSASKSGEKLSDAPGIISVLSRDEIERFGGITLRDLLERIPGLSGTTTYFTDRSLVSVRGDQIKTTGSHVLYLINGRPIREVQEGGIISDVIESFPVSVIERIEVIKGPGSVLYGTNAFSGVINIITRVEDETKVSVSALAGNGGAIGTNGHVNISLGDLKIILAGKYHKKAEYDVEYLHSPSDGVVNSYTITIPDNASSAFVDLQYKGLRFLSSINQWESRYFVRGNFGLNKWTKYFNNLGYGFDISESWKMDMNVTYIPTILKASEFPFNERNSSDLVAEWTNFVKLNEKSKIVIGGLYNHVQGKEFIHNVDPVLYVTDDKRPSFGVYAQMDYQIIESLKLIGGAQLNKVENIDLNFVPRIGLIWYPVSSIHVKALYGQAFRAPSINEFGLDFVALQGDPNLVPENVDNFDFSIGYQAEKFQVKANYFNSKQTNIVIADRSVTPGLYKNLGEFNIQGAELEGKYFVNQQLFVSFSTLYQVNENQDGVENVSPISGFGFKGGLSYKSEKGLTVSLFNIYQGELDDSFDATLNPDPGSYNLLNAYLNLSIGELFNLGWKQKISLFVEAENLLDQEVWAPEWGGIVGESIPMHPGMELNVGISATF